MSAIRQVPGRQTSAMRVARLVSLSATLVLAIGCTAGPAAPSAPTAPPPAATAVAKTGATAAAVAPTIASTCNTAYSVANPNSTACRFEGQTLTIGSLSGAFTDALKVGIGTIFEERTGGKINWVASDPQTVISQLVAAKGSTPPFDVVLLDSPSATRALQSDVLQKVNYANVPNIAALPPAAFRAEGYGPGVYYFLMGNCFNADRFQQAGIPEPAGLEALFDPRLANRVGLPDTTHANWAIVMPSIAKSFGQPLSSPDPVVERFKSIQGVKLFASSADLETDMTSGDVWAALNSDGRCNGRAARGEPWRFGPLNLTIDGKAYDYVGITTGPEIVAGTRNVAMAETFINLLLTPEGINPVAKQFVYTPTFPPAAEALAQDPAIAPFILTKFDRLYPANTEEFLPHLNAWVASWNRAFKG